MLRSPVVAALSLGLAALFLAPAANAQGEDDGCTSREPCPLIVDLDESGFYIVGDVFFGQAGEPDHIEFTVGDWYKLIVDSMDPNRSHTVSLTGHDVDVSVTVGPDGFAPDSEAFLFEKLGTYTLRDQPSGDEFEVRVVEEDVSDTSPGSASDDDKGAPGLGLVALVALLAGVAAARRR